MGNERLKDLQKQIELLNMFIERSKSVDEVNYYCVPIGALAAQDVVTSGAKKQLMGDKVITRHLVYKLHVSAKKACVLSANGRGVLKMAVVFQVDKKRAQALVKILKQEEVRLSADNARKRIPNRRLNRTMLDFINNLDKRKVPWKRRHYVVGLHTNDIHFPNLEVLAKNCQRLSVLSYVARASKVHAKLVQALFKSSLPPTRILKLKRIWEVHIKNLKEVRKKIVNGTLDLL